jgi:putative membrane protein
MKSTIKIMMALGLAMAANGALAEDTNSPAQSTLQTPVTDAEFAWNASVANLKEIRLAQYAEQNSTNTEVLTFAKHMIRDHSAANRKLTKITSAENINLPDTNAFYVVVNEDPGKQATQLMQHDTPENILKEQQISAQQLEALAGQNFDQAYADAMVKDHADAIQLFENASENVTNEDLKKFATKNLPTLHRHYDLAQALQNDVSSVQSTNTPGTNMQTNTIPVSSGTGM